MTKKTAIVVIGAGPAGLSAAIAAAAAGAAVTAVEQLDRPGMKLLATGGGRCNVTNTLPPEELAGRFGRQWRFLLPALEALPPEELRRYFGKHGTPLEAADGFHVFPKSNRAGDILRALLDHAAALGVNIIAGATAESLVIEQGRLAGVRTSAGFLSAEKVIVATGGKSYPKLGATGSGYALAEQAGHRIAPPKPALVGLQTCEDWPGRCTGIVLENVEIRLDLPGERGLKSRGELLFTHRGVSGPAVLDLSGRAAELLDKLKTVPLAVNLLPALAAADWRNLFDVWQKQYGKRQLSTLLSGEFPARLATELCRLAGDIGELKAAEFPAPAREKLCRTLTALPLAVTGTEGWHKAMVTRGGVELKKVAPETLESRLLPGLHFAGEVLDLDGPCGGYNLQWAFSSGFLAGTAAAGPDESGRADS